MLFILTGDIQIGKTRWLQSLVSSLTQDGVLCSGVLAPGDWVEQPDGTFEKRGIDNILLPQGEIIPFARRADIAREEGVYDQNSASARAKLRWEISDEAIARVNAHFAQLTQGAGLQGAFGAYDGPELLIVDEFGQLELRRGEGLTEALALVQAGSPQGSDSIPKHCLIVVREWLVAEAKEKFGNVWGASIVIGPDETGVSLLRQTLEWESSSPLPFNDLDNHR